MDNLTDSQRRSLDEFQQITASQDPEASRRALERHDWSLESSVHSYLDGDEKYEDPDVADEPLLGHQATSSGSSRPSTGFSRVRSCDLLGNPPTPEADLVFL